MTDTVLDGPFLVAALLAVAAGAVSFASPCVVPLVPGYLSYLASLVGAEGAAVPVAAGRGGARPATTGAAGGARRRAAVALRTRAVGATALFVVGFTLVFLAQSALVLGAARFLLRNAEVLTRVGGVVTVVMGLAMLGWIRPLQRERRWHARPGGRAAGAVALGAVFGLGWTVCIGPTLAGVLALAASTEWNGNAWRGLALVVCYCAGLGVPFLLLAFGFSWASRALGVLRRHARTVQVVGAVLLVAIGLAMVTGLWGQWVAWLQVRVAGTGTVL
ncbi:cytochrome c biogenesis CcdA family protein [Nakamurella endophytica]|uniref:Cytochrome C biogenesis protein CcdA n=1 Tax=Nakamurella endophytica TaxID=1748367 RepID=A0A917SYQ4_9ACTN|nr:cytochrome c biogenesis protein CcdA [Nakamurella endophytica]GGM04033.1 cytochrome C biogenesis protein CcdA [Nakamurella endophytica]